MERSDLKGNQVHWSGWINWWAKAEFLTFYNDEEEHEEQPKPPPKPRRSKYKPESQYLEEVEAWEAAKPRAQEVKPKGNLMSQKYYCDNILPQFIDAINQERLNSRTLPEAVWLQEDGDSSHGNKGNGLAKKLREANWIPEFEHPA
ncbi:hypothetical protein EV356DRAFT_571833 [Viridothelium virens]|uniref:Uncharacterized protein n=1 Tax=Viridothelium virens TaxID=1048519 RepID=A0A6A6GRU1_VIRVR|nr:hypothetical protein EV356DRAFT_571833 [Viridothelium virens]